MAYVYFRTVLVEYPIVHVALPSEFHKFSCVARRTPPPSATPAPISFRTGKQLKPKRTVPWFVSVLHSAPASSAAHASSNTTINPRTKRVKTQAAQQPQASTSQLTSPLSSDNAPVRLVATVQPPAVANGAVRAPSSTNPASRSPPQIPDEEDEPYHPAFGWHA